MPLSRPSRRRESCPTTKPLSSTSPAGATRTSSPLPMPLTIRPGRNLSGKRERNMQLAEQLRHARTKKEILLMTHLVLGYPSFAVNRKVIDQMVTNGVDVIELQIPFSEPMADGPMIIKANQESIANGTKVADCLAFAEEMAAQYDIPFLFMTYYNILFKYGVKEFLLKAKEIGIRGFIIPDLPPEEGEEYLQLAKELDLAAIQ